MVKRWQAGDGMHLDLRGGVPPEPMIEILTEIDEGADGPLILHMDRDPVLLYPELEARGWSARLISQDDLAEGDEAVVILEVRPDSAL